jgi:hypothetical protein
VPERKVANFLVSNKTDEYLLNYYSIEHQQWSVIKPALASIHGADVIEKQVSVYYVADEISATYRGKMIAIEYDN